jgi:membrane protease YdiL (CAAX protease family)
MSEAYKKENLMNPITSFIKRHPLVTFFVLAYAFSWWPWLLSGVPLFPWGPMVAALILTAVINGRAGLKALLSRVVQWRVNLRWYGVALLLPVALGLSAFGLNLLLGAPMPAAAQLPPLVAILQVLLAQLFFIQIGEELGWRGFALPRLLEGRSALAASLILGLLWLGWHLPAYATGTISAIFIPLPFITSFLFTWLYQHTHGSVLIAIMFHSMLNTVGAILYPLFTGVYLEQTLLLFVMANLLTAVAVVVIAGLNLRRQPVPLVADAPSVS